VVGRREAWQLLGYLFADSDDVCHIQRVGLAEARLRADARTARSPRSCRWRGQYPAPGRPHTGSRPRRRRGAPGSRPCTHAGSPGSWSQTTPIPARSQPSAGS
jgi:hypothetical protein